MSTVMAPDSLAEATAGKYLTFMLGNETYGIQILKVQEIIGLLPITRVPKAPEFIRGVINLRGKVIPVLDLSRKFNMHTREDSARTCIIVVQLRDGHNRIMGMVVDDVSEVADITAAQIEPPPDVMNSREAGCLLGIGKINQHVVMLLDVEQVLDFEQTSLLETR